MFSFFNIRDLLDLLIGMGIHKQTSSGRIDGLLVLESIKMIFAISVDDNFIFLQSFLLFRIKALSPMSLFHVRPSVLPKSTQIIILYSFVTKANGPQTRSALD